MNSGKEGKMNKREKESEKKENHKSAVSWKVLLYVIH